MDIDEAIEAVKRLPVRGSIAREAARIRRDELDGSLAIAGARLSRPELDALCDRALALGGHPFEHYLQARDLAAAAAWASDQQAIAAGDPRPLITIEDVRRLHVAAMSGQPACRPGVWRLGVEPISDAGIVYPAPWLVAKETMLLVDRHRRRPATRDVPAWLAAFLGRYARIRPFTSGNGRASRLAASLRLRRLDIAPLAIPRERAAEYRNAIVASAGGDAQPLQRLIFDALLESCLRLIAAGGEEPLQPLRSLAGSDYAALIKAAKRGRLHTVTRAGRVLSTGSWIANYRAERWNAAAESVTRDRSVNARVSES